jgi:hypothetical protein
LNFRRFAPQKNHDAGGTPALPGLSRQEGRDAFAHHNRVLPGIEGGRRFDSSVKTRLVTIDEEFMMFQSTPVTERQRRLEELTPLPNEIIPLKGEISNRSQFLMKKTLVVVLSLLSAAPLMAKTWVLTDSEANLELGNWKAGSEVLKIKDKKFTVEQKVLRGGKQEGSKIIEIKSADGLTITLSPTRGMNLLKVEGFGVRLGWDSPVKEVVHPAFINLESRNGAGWLEGFNEMMVRCGYEWTGHPITADGQIYTLHGKAGNTPASRVEVEIGEKAPYEIRIRGLVRESTFKKGDLQTLTELRYTPGSEVFSIHDRLSNHGDYPHDYQIIYHSNFGRPILEEGAQFIAPVRKISPFNDYAKAGLNTWQSYAAPTRDFDEMVFNIEPLADAKGKTLAALVNRFGDKGVAVGFDLGQLPVLTLWKNTDTEKQGYVTGIEPGTSYAYPVTIEREQGRVKRLEPGATAEFDLSYELIHDKRQTEAVKEKVAAIQGSEKAQQVNEPIAKE